MDKHRKITTTISNKGILYQLDKNIKLFSSKEEADKYFNNNKIKGKFLCKIDLNQDAYDISMKEEDSSINEDDNDSFNDIDIDNISWIISKYVFENSRENGYKLHKGDILKLGKYILKVKEIGLEEEDKRVVIERKNTQKFIKNKNNNNNNINISQIPLNNNQQENYSTILNINQNIQNNDNGNNNSNNESENESSKGNNIHIIEHEN